MYGKLGSTLVGQIHVQLNVSKSSLRFLNVRMQLSNAELDIHKK